MDFIAFGANHRTASVERRDRFALTPSTMPEALRRAMANETVHEVMILSTCNRTEIFAVVEDGKEVSHEAPKGEPPYRHTPGIRLKPSRDASGCDSTQD